MIQSTLLAGVTGSGKSFTENLIINKIINDGADLVLCDPKRIELCEFENKAIKYADNEDDIFDAIVSVRDMMDERYVRMKKEHVKLSTEKPVYLIIDELAPLVSKSCSYNKQIVDQLEQIAMLGRASRVFQIVCSQFVQRSVLSSRISMNMTNRVCLRQMKSTDYRTFLDQSLPPLPRIGYAYVMTPDFMHGAKKMRVEDVPDALDI